MKKPSFFSIGSLILGAAVCLVPSCSQDANLGIDGTTTEAGSTTLNATSTRQCTKTMSGATSNGLNDFLQPGSSVTNIEPPVTYCLTSGNNATFRIEFEADAGIYYATFGSTPPIYAISTTSGSTRQVNIIFMDGFGLVQIVGSGSASGTITAQVKYYNFPSYQQALQDAINQMETNCNQSLPNHWTVAQCEGYGPPVPWWQQTSNQTVLSQAQTILADPTKTSVLGTISY